MGNVVRAETRFGARLPVGGYEDMVNELVSSGELGIEANVALSELLQDVAAYKGQARALRLQRAALCAFAVAEALAFAAWVLS